MVRLNPHYLCVAILGVAVVLSAARVSEAQRRGRGGMRLGNVSAVFLLQLPEVQAELKLTDEQKTKSAGVLTKLAEGRSEVIANVAKDSHQRGPKIAALSEQADKDVQTLLDETQRKRLQQLVLQVNGPNELENEDIQAALHLTDDQKAKLAEVSRGNAKTRRESLANFVGDRWEKVNELHKEANQKLLDVLTPEQQKQFDEMQGAKITIDVFSG